MSAGAGAGVGAGFDAGLDTGSRLKIGRHFRLQWEEVQKAWVLLYPEGMVKLNGSAGEILRLCDGQRTGAGIVTELEALFGTSGLEGDVRSFFEIALKQGWVEQVPADAPAATESSDPVT